MNVKSEYKFDDDELDEVYTWVDGFRLSRDKKNIARDFSDGILVGEIIKSVDPSLVELKQLVQTLNTKTKFGNWETLNRMTFAKMGFRYSDEDVDGIVNFKPLAVENALRILRVKVEMYIRQKHEMRGNNYTSQLQEAYGQQGAQQPGNSGSPPRLQAELPEIKQRGNAKAKTRNGENETAISANYSQKQIKQRLRSSEDVQGRNASRKVKGEKRTNKDMENLSELEKKDVIIDGLQSTVNILHMKIAKLEQLLNLKQQKIQYLENSMNGG